MKEEKNPSDMKEWEYGDNKEWEYGGNEEWYASNISDGSKINSSIVGKLREDNNLLEEQDAAYKKLEKSYIRKK